MRGSYMILGLAALLAYPWLNAAAEDAAPVDDKAAAPAVNIRREMHMNIEPRPDFREKKLFVRFKGSEKGTQFVRAKLAGNGYKVVDNESDADFTVDVDGAFHVIGAGKEPLKGRLGELLEASLEPGAGNSPDYTHQNINLMQIAASSVPLGGISISQLIQWVSQKTGIAGRFNEAITGDPRGWCWAESCKQRISGAVFAVRAGDNGRWWVFSEARDPRMLLDLVVMDAIDSGLKPLYGLKQAKLSQNEGQKHD